VLALPARAAEAPKARDCSAEPAPDGKLVLRIDERSYPLGVATIRSQQKMSIGDEDAKESFEVFGISLRDAESIFPPHQIEGLADGARRREARRAGRSAASRSTT
jgi:hypothetical protein